MRRWVLRLFFLAAIAGTTLLVVRRRGVGAEPTMRPVWPALEEGKDDPPLLAAVAENVPASARWSDPVEKACPPGFEVKVKLASGIYHLPGMFAYDRTIPDRCYASPEAAESDGFRAAKR